MSAEPSERRQRIVMALGIATIILFSANLLTVLAHHFWPENGFNRFQTEELAVADAPIVTDIHVDVDVERHPFHKKRVIVRFPKHGSIHMDELDRELADMERAARDLEREIDRELAEWNVDGIHVHAVQAIEAATQTVEGAEIKILMESTLEEALRTAERAAEEYEEAGMEVELRKLMEEIQVEVESKLREARERADASGR